MNRRNRILLLYSAGYIGISVLMQTIVKWYQYFYAPPEFNEGGLRILVPLSLIGFAMIIGRIFDSVADPLVAYLSDTCKSRLGRRIPFVLYGSLPMVLTFVLLWFPPVQGVSLWNFVYLTVILSMYFVFFTIVVGPYLALIGEIGRTREERIRLTMFQGIAQVLGVMIAEAGSGALILTGGYRVMGIVLGTFSFGVLLLTPIFVKEEKGPAQTEAAPSIGMRASLLKTFQNRNFICYLIPYLALWFGINTLTIAMPYISEVLLGMAPEASGFLVAGAFVLAIIFSPFLPRIILRYGKKNVMIASSFVFSLILISMGFFGTLITGAAAIGIVILAGIPLAAALVVPNAMVADIAEMDGLKNGIRREGMFFGAQGLVNKLVLGLSSLVTPLLFNTFGFTAEHPLGLKLCGPAAGVLLLLTLRVLMRYRLDEVQLEHIREVEGA